MVGLGLDEVVILTKSYTRSIDSMKLSQVEATTGVLNNRRPQKSRPAHHPVAQTLYDCASLMLCSFLVKVVVMSAVAFIPIPLMRSFSIQVGRVCGRVWPAFIDNSTLS